METVMVTGSDGFCGWPIVLKLLKKGYKVIGVDNRYRRFWVTEVNSTSAIPIFEPSVRIKKANEVYGGRYYYEEIDISDYDSITTAITKYKPSTILHLAAQPSAPYSAIDIHHCNFTQTNNTQMLRNIMWALNDLKMYDTHLIVTTTTGIYGAPDFDIPEGNIIINKDEIPFPSMGGSWYHMSRAHDAANLWLANKQYNFSITELRTSIVCGSSTEETREYIEFTNRFDVDFYFGVVTNRFVSQALKDQKLTVYGKGLQRKPMISLTDMVNSTVACFEKGVGDKKYNIYNQLEREISIVDIANTIKGFCEKTFDSSIDVLHIPNPRVEDEEHQMIIKNNRFLSDLCDGKISCKLIEAIEQICKDLYLYKGGL